MINYITGLAVKISSSSIIALNCMTINTTILEYNHLDMLLCLFGFDLFPVSTILMYTNIIHSNTSYSNTTIHNIHKKKPIRNSQIYDCLIVYN